MKILSKFARFCNQIIFDLLKDEDGNYSRSKIGLILLTFASYSWIFNWKFAIVLMVAIGWHESGHIWALRRFGMPTSGFFFLPFLGGVAVSTSPHRSLKEKIIVALMGPIWGMLLAFLTLILYLITDNEFLGAAAKWQAIVNLFNLLPVHPLDGGQIVKSVCRSVSAITSNVFSLISAAAFIGLFALSKSPIFILGFVMAARDFWMEYKYESSDSIGIQLNWRDALMTALSYFILIITLLCIWASASHITLDLTK